MNGVLKYFNDMDKFQIISGVGFKVLEELLYYQATQITSNEEKNEKAKEELGWEPKKSLKDMISSAWNWIKNDSWKKH